MDLKKACREAASNVAEESVPTERELSDKSRESWGQQWEFIFAMLGYSVGLGNVWRFPYLCYKNGGGAFLVPYMLCAVVAGIPLFFLEVALGQYTQQSAINVWKLVPSMKGVGFGCTIINTIFSIYNVIVMAWAAYYLVQSVLPGALPWTSCNNTWNTPSCVEANVISNNNLSTNITMLLNSTFRAPDNTTVTTSPEAEFWRRNVLVQSSGLEEIGNISNWLLFACFLVCWLVIYLCVFKGAKCSGKVVMVTATLPYVLLLLLLIRGATLDGAGAGIVYLLRPNFTRLADSQVWVDAGGQIFFSYGICFTVLMTFGSFNKFSNNCYRQCVVLASTCSLTSLFASMVIFSILGHMAHVQSKDISEVATSGPGLIFMVYPVGLSLLPAPKLWSFLFFATLFMVGIDTQFASVEGVVTTIADMFPRLVKPKHGRAKLSAVVCLVLLLCGLPLLANGGIFLFELMNTYGASGISLLWLVFFQSVAIGWLYDAKRFYADVKSMIGYEPNPYFNYCYRFFTPAVAAFIFFFYCVKYTPLTLDNYIYPAWAIALGWIMSLMSILCVPLGLAWHALKTKGKCVQRPSAERKPFPLSDWKTNPETPAAELLPMNGTGHDEVNGHV